MNQNGFAVNFSEWVDDVGGVNKAADILGEKYSTVRSWYCLSRAPCARAAGRIIRITAGRLDYNGIYSPYVAALQARDGAQ